MSANYTATATATGASASLHLSAGSRWALQVTSATWGVATIQHSADGGTTWTTMRTFDDSAEISLTANRLYSVSGGLSYRLNVSTYSAAIKLVAQPISD